MWTAVTAAAALVIAFEICARLWPGDALGSAERATFVSLAGSSIWLGSTWAAALLHQLTRPVLIARTLLFVAVAIVIVVRRVRTMRRPAAPRLRSAMLLLPLLLWIGFVAWRSVIVPPLTHDALSYHLPRALMFARAGGYGSLTPLDFVMTPRPANYEILLAEALVMDGVDDYSEWLSVLAYIGFVVAAAGLAQRWSRGNREAMLAVALFTAASPVVLLHSGAHKNDLLTAYWLTAALVAAGRWLGDRDVPALVLSAAGFAAAIGTKTPAFLVPLFLAPFLAWPMFRERMPWKRVVVLAVMAVVLFFALGGWSLVSAQLEKTEASAASADGRQYGDWENLWRGPWVLMAAPFSPSGYELAVPWSPKPWFWRRFEIYFSELGVAFSICALLLPVALLRQRSHETIAIVTATLAAVAVILPVHRVPSGFHLIGLPRIVMHLAPVVFAATITAWSRHARVLSAAAAMLFVFYAIPCAIEDNFIPLSFLEYARAHPGTRTVPFMPNRGPEIVDRAAGPNDVIAIDAGEGAWIYCAYGARLTRRVVLIPPGNGAPAIPPDAQWLVVDRIWNRTWGDPRFTDLGDWRSRLGFGEAEPLDLRVIHYALASGEFEKVYFDPRTLQAVFRRKR